MRSVDVYRNGEFAGVLTEETHNLYVFRYDDKYISEPGSRSISLTMPKRKQEYRSEILFPFFYNMISEGVNRKIQCLQNKIDENDSFGLLMSTAQYDTIGAITVKMNTRDATT